MNTEFTNLLSAITQINNQEALVEVETINTASNTISHLKKQEQVIDGLLESIENVNIDHFYETQKMVELLMRLYLAYSDYNKYVNELDHFATDVFRTHYDLHDKRPKEYVETTKNVTCLAQKTLKENGPYELASTPNYIITNNDYSGITIYNQHLEEIKDIIINEKVIISDIYKRFDNNALLLYNNEENHIIYIDLVTDEYYSMDLPTQYKNIILTKVYWWEHDTLYFTSNDDECFSFSIQEKSFKQISKDTLQKLVSDFYYFWAQSKNHKILTVDSKNNMMLSDHEEQKQVTLLNTKTNKSIHFERPRIVGHDAEIIDDKILFVICFKCDQEWNTPEKILLIGYNEPTLITIEKPYQFLSAKFITPYKIVILASNYSNHRESKLFVYEVK